MLEISVVTKNIYYKKGLHEVISHEFEVENITNNPQGCDYVIKNKNPIKLYLYDEFAILATIERTEKKMSINNLYARDVMIKKNSNKNIADIIKEILTKIKNDNNITSQKAPLKNKNRNAHARGFYLLSLREKVVMDLIGKGIKQEKISSLLGCSEKSVYNYKRSLISKQRLRSKYQLYRLATSIAANKEMQQYLFWEMYNLITINNSPPNTD
ncbi:MULTISPECIES: helix-turn-helix domain-containing protein [unclassified Erwinia]|uniref:helix-turn-helix domain-containing protein n=1 Tax=unclassified Erwinia TaxID=2622719 RepID=UPI000C19AC36|nr:MULTISPECIES: helix-turn-helix transcriptional regulator [unclassified Erwinia]PIJ49600.1 hypothetical protein BV501_12080 [Erwinia sp. OAMSP11]PIJ71596.1 hypothetical protein BK416_11310 [Erwinia sp. OLSSP12]PIJ82666.1 hypothetical protein BLD47_06075 [Erwinia sp. OLCASP19]PIJ83133.1 hypothetical protein BLD46_10170 [Erwinia sp. OLMTSP26]PIJ85299.1 hypothetical protein BLD49_10730 [Erwinia sp. OLMDSP33]